MAPTKEVHFRLRRSTVDKLREELDRSPHRSLTALADELLEEAIRNRRNDIDCRDESRDD